MVVVVSAAVLLRRRLALYTWARALTTTCVGVTTQRSGSGAIDISCAGL